MIEGPYDDFMAWVRTAKLTNGQRVLDQPWVRLNIARIHARLDFIRLCRLMLEVLGQPGTLRKGSPEALVGGRIEFLLRTIHILTFGGGTNEMQRDLIALFGLGMPVMPRF
jgi:alkylation response protein AidB-like acyl-CoA dehydrogenase